MRVFSRPRGRPCVDCSGILLIAYSLQPHPQGLLGFQYGGGSGEDPGKQQNYVTKISNEDGNLFKMAATAKRVRKSGYEIRLR